jgi:hypothetical protein
LQNGNSNVTITANGNVTLNAVGGARIIATSTGANITGTLGVSGNLTAGNLIGPYANGNSNVNMPAANGNINMSVAGNANVLVVTGTGISSTRINPRIGAIASAATITPTGDTSDQYEVTALATAATIAIPSGTPVNGQKLTIRIDDNGTARALTWTTSAGGYRAIGTTLPTTTVISKTVYIGCIYNSTAGFWDVIAVAQQA